MKGIKVYKHDFGYAREHEEIEAYRESLMANRECAAAIDKAVADNYNNYCLDGEAAIKQVVTEYGLERTLYVLANAVRHKEHDGRIAPANKKWAAENYILSDANAHDDRTLSYITTAHPGLIDLLVTRARKMPDEITPLVEEEIKAEAKRILESFNKLTTPNSFSGTHYQVEISREFMFRASTKDTDKLARFLPYNTLCFSTVKGERGVYAQISAKESRKTELRIPKPRGRSKKVKEEMER